MAVLAYVENWEGRFKKASFEIVYYAAELAKQLQTEAIALVLGEVADDPSVLGKYGAQKVLVANASSLHTFNNKAYAKAIHEVTEQTGATTVVISNTNNGKSVAPLLSVYAEAALISNTIGLPSSTAPFTIKRKAFSGKGFVDFASEASRRVLSLTPNAFGVVEGEGAASVETVDISVGEQDVNSTVESVDRATGKVPLPEAELVVSAGRGLKGPENWGMVEELADLLGAGTACSKPVSDMGWRSHSEHVGQTGIAINPQLYIAIGISGAIQHLAGVSASKNIVVINKDPEAPFFKAANYGVVGDAFEVVPRLIEALKTHQATN